MGLRLDPSKLMGREVSPEETPLPAPQDDAAHAENLRLLAELEALKAKLAAAATVPEKLAVTTFPGEVARVKSGDAEVVIIRDTNQKGNPTIKAYRVTGTTIGRFALVSHEVETWRKPEVEAAYRACIEQAHKEA